jgi:hypothetical protein
MITEKISGKQPLTIDPGSLMLAMYVLAVTALVLFGWFGAAGAGGETKVAEAAVVQNVTDQAR